MRPYLDNHGQRLPHGPCPCQRPAHNHVHCWAITCPSPGCLKRFEVDKPAVYSVPQHERLYRRMGMIFETCPVQGDRVRAVLVYETLFGGTK